MSANINDYMEMFGAIEAESFAMPKCACVACNSCTCACSCRAFPEQEDIDW
ncbi:FibroRumin family radical SAM-modified Cys-rich RiPP [Coriobacteriales bacterium OH1046]|nr:FibroRumin family radical SAM-modified Cys-rich RiPP [Coriobacteriales bacterium OH1046]